MTDNRIIFEAEGFRLVDRGGRALVMRAHSHRMDGSHVWVDTVSSEAIDWVSKNLIPRPKFSCGETVWFRRFKTHFAEAKVIKGYIEDCCWDRGVWYYSVRTGVGTETEYHECVYATEEEARAALEE